jgi:ATP-dependent Clp protease ATP-binding subunit ClpC
MFERFTEKARRVIFFARYEASQFGGELIETEHLLLGLLREDKALARRFLQGNTIETLRPEIEQQTTLRGKVSTSIDLPLSDESKRVLAYSAEEAERLNHRHIGTEHLLLGVLREEKCFGARLLNARGVTLEKVRQELAQKAHPVPMEVRSREALSPASSRNALVPLKSLHPLIGRANELDRILHILGCFNAKSPVLIGEPGVGKRTIVGGLAQRIADGAIPSFLAGVSVVELDLPPWNSVGSAWFDNFHAELPKAAEQGTILLVDELHASPDGVFWRGMAHLQELLKHPIANGQLQCISLATPKNYAQAIAEHGWLETCFQPIPVSPATEEESLGVLRGVKHLYEEFHELTYSEDALSSAVAYAGAWIPDRYLPGKAVDLMDEAGSAVRMRDLNIPQEVVELQKRIRLIANRIDAAIENHEFAIARFHSDEERKERENLRVLRQKHQKEGTPAPEVTREDIEGVVSRWTGATLEAIRKSVPPVKP